MSKILVPTRGTEDWRLLLADPEKHWKHGYSAMAVAQCWETANGLPADFLSILGQDAELLLAIPEHKVALPGGTRESQCDVFALVRTGEHTCALSVEAKVNEAFGPTVGDWLDKASKGKAKRLTSICEMFGAAYPPPDNLRYQLFHRTAAAIVESARFKTDTAAMIVQSFSREHRWYEDFEAFCDFLGVSAARGAPIVTKLPNGKPLILGWATSEIL